MAPFFFSLCPERGLSLFFKAYPVWGIQFLFFLFLLISHRELLLLVQGHERSNEDSDQ